MKSFRKLESETGIRRRALAELHRSIPSILTMVTYKHKKKGPYSSRLNLSDFDLWIHNDENKLFQLDCRASSNVVTFWTALDIDTRLYVNEYRECQRRSYSDTKEEIYETYQKLRLPLGNVPSRTKLQGALCKCVHKFTIRECCCSVCLQEREFLTAYDRSRHGARRERTVDGLGSTCCDVCFHYKSNYWICTKSVRSFTRTSLCEFQRMPKFSI